MNVLTKGRLEKKGSEQLLELAMDIHPEFFDSKKISYITGYWCLLRKRIIRPFSKNSKVVKRVVAEIGILLRKSVFFK